jgi:tripartite-type tricarboxylate transporter receptor subunit TctC
MIPRRRFLAAALAAPMLAVPLRAAAWTPGRPVRLIAPFAPGGTSDLVARVFQAPLAEWAGQTVVVENRPGAGGVLGTEMLVRSAPDGLTLLVLNSGHAVNATLMERLPFDPVTSLQPISMLARSPLILAVPHGSPISSAAGLAELARSLRRPLTYASAGNGQTNHIAGEMLRLATGLDMTHVPYRGGGPLLQDLLAGRVDMAFATPASALSQVTGGALRALAVTGERRMAALPGIPTTAEAGLPAVTIVDWWGLVAPAGLPAEILAAWHGSAQRAAASPATVARLTAQGLEVTPGTPDAFRAELQRDIARYAEIIRTASIRPD